MPDLLLILTAFSAYTAILGALGYVVGRIHANYQVTYRMVRRQLREREARAVKQEALATEAMRQLNEAKEAAITAHRELERAQSEMAKSKGLVA